MRRKINKALAMLMAVAMTCSTVQLQAFAQTTKEQEQVITIEEQATEEKEAVESETINEASTIVEERTTQAEEIQAEESKTEEAMTEEVMTEAVKTEAVQTEETQTEESEEIETESIVEEAKDTSWDGETTQSIYEAEDFKVTFTVSSYWEDGFTADIKIENTTDLDIQNWYLDIPLANKITTIWNAEIDTTQETGYIIKNAVHNQDIPAGSSIEFGIASEEAFKGFPQSYTLLGDVLAAEETDYTITYTLENDWESGFKANISITNHREKALEDWILEFDFNREITNIWDAVIVSNENNHYVIRNAGYYSNIAAGETVTFGFTGESGDSDTKPTNYQLYSYLPVEEKKTETDLEADTEQDGLPDFMEEYFGTDKTREDTDGDGLSDYIEIYVLAYDPLLKDTDGNGIIDSEEDLDQDGLNNKKEIEIGTSIVYTDTDEDNLSDYEEVMMYGTNPLKADTDADGATDAKEIEIGTNPLVAESTFALSIKAEEEDTVQVSVSTVLSGTQVDSFRVEKYENDLFFPETMPGYIGGAYDFSVDGSIDSATIRFEFDAALLKDTSFDPVIYYFNEETQLLEELATTVNGNVASATVSHFSKYILLNRTVYEDSFTWQDVWSSTGYTGVEVVLVIDDSGSMTSNDRYKERLTVAQNLIDKLPENSKVGIVKFSYSTRILTGALISDKEEAKSYLTTNYFISSGGTWMYEAMNRSFSLYEDTDDTKLKMMVVLSDGETADSYMHSRVIETAKSANIKIYTVGLGSSTEYFTSYLKPLAEQTAGAFYLASNADQLAAIYQDINQKIDIETDSDGDGIADYYEENMTLFNGITIKLDKNNPDSDGDGLYDGEEVVELNYQYNEDKTQVIVTGKLLSDPLNADTDGDGLTDEEEIYYYGTDPFKADTDGDGLTDSLEIELWFDPLQADADGDGRLDLQEYQEGTSPFNYDKDWYEYVWDFTWGFIAGDFIEDPDNMAMLAGQIVSSLIPLADVRDVVANLVHGDYLFAGLSVLGLVPTVGDVVKVAGKVGKFIVKNLDQASEVIKILEFLNKNFPDMLKSLGKNDTFVDAIDQFTKADNLKLTKNQKNRWNEILERVELEDYVFDGGSESGKTTNVELNSFGNASRPRGARPKDFGVNGMDDIVGPEMPPLPNGASNAADVNLAPLSGHYYKLPAGTVLPDGLGVVADGSDVIPNSGRFPGHHTIYPTREMTVNEFNELYLSLPWVHGGKKP